MRRIPVASLALLLLTGCATTSGDAPPSGLTLSVYQNRTDVAARKLEVSFLNNTGSALTVTRLELRAGQFDGKAVWPKKSTTIAPGLTISLPVPLPEPDCTAAPTEPEFELKAEFDYQLADGRAGTAVSTPVDTLDRLPGIRRDDCIALSVASMVTVSIDTPPRTSTIAGRTIAEIDLTLTPTGATGSVTFESASSTTLLTPVSMEGLDTAQASIVRTIAGTGEPATVTVHYAPNRCDAHAIAEDKRGTIFAITVSTTDGFSGPLYVSAADDVRNALYAFVRTACGLPTS